jgi:hypothetical protein
MHGTQAENPWQKLPKTIDKETRNARNYPEQLCGFRSVTLFFIV